MTNGAPNYELHSLFTLFLDEAVDWAEELELSLILDNHTFDPFVSTDPNIGNILIPVWRNMAEHFKDRSKLVYYEILNEPHGIEDAIWNNIQQQVIDEIRNIDSIHTIIVGPAGWNSYNNLSAMPVYDDDNLIYTFHFYDPFLFTHQGASWVTPSLVPLSGVPFPYNPLSMPPVPPELIGTWVGDALNNYSNDGTISKVRQLIDIAYEFKSIRNVQVFCGEFGVLMDNANNNDRVLWYNIVRTYLEHREIPWTTWDYHGGFGLFEKNSSGIFEHDLNINLIAALGFNVPPQSEFELKPDSTGFGIYSDFIEPGIASNSYTKGELNFYNNNAKEGDYCISWSNPSQYDAVRFQFTPIKDLTYLLDNNYNVGFWIKGDNPNIKFQIRFVDTKINDEDHPWRMSYDIDTFAALFNGQWQYVEIPLSNFYETGSWDNGWYNPQGLFDWGNVNLFEIVDEFGNLSQNEIFIDEIKIFDPNSTGIEEEIFAKEFKLFQNYPNPFNPTTKIKFSIPSYGINKQSEKITLRIYDILGKEIKTLVNHQLRPGIYEVEFNASYLASGVYIYKLTSSSFVDTKQMMLVK
ncbi:hypothetical protein ASZ90_004607 [hydrocarbon metagenome]|uniref:Uncharacterized protein n=1 Tax=hydrocarbon metagenome TaxID=938273 RepID=A0A0W8FXM5_9ZZZZ